MVGREVGLRKSVESLPALMVMMMRMELRKMTSEEEEDALEFDGPDVQMEERPGETCEEEDRAAR